MIADRTASMMDRTGGLVLALAGENGAMGQHRRRLLGQLALGCLVATPCLPLALSHFLTFSTAMPVAFALTGASALIGAMAILHLNLPAMARPDPALSSDRADAERWNGPDLDQLPGL